MRSPSSTVPWSGPPSTLTVSAKAALPTQPSKVRLNSPTAIIQCEEIIFSLSLLPPKSKLFRRSGISVRRGSREQVIKLRDQVLTREPVVVLQGLRDLLYVCQLNRGVDRVRAFFCPCCSLLRRDRLHGRAGFVLKPKEPHGAVSGAAAHPERLKCAESLIDGVLRNLGC